MVLKRPFMSDTGEALTLHIQAQVSQETEFRIILLGHKALSQHDSWNGKMALKKPFINDTGEDSALHIHF